MENEILKKLEDILKELAPDGQRGLDISSLKIFIKNYKNFIRVSEKNEAKQTIPFDEALDIIKAFLEDKKAFPRIKDVIDFANDKLGIDFKDQKESREITISRIISRIKQKPKLKDTLKKAVISIRNEVVHGTKEKPTKKELITAETYSKWAEIIKNI